MQNNMFKICPGNLTGNEPNRDPAVAIALHYLPEHSLARVCTRGFEPSGMFVETARRPEPARGVPT